MQFTLITTWQNATAVTLLTLAKCHLRLLLMRVTSLKNMAGLVNIPTGQVNETGAEVWAGFADSGAGFQNFGAESQSLGQMVETSGGCREMGRRDKQERVKKRKLI